MSAGATDPPAARSTRRVTRETGQFTRSTPGSQSLQRGLQLLRVFRPGFGVLSNAQLSLRTGLPRATVSRLSRSLVDAGFLAHDQQGGGYRLAPVCLSLALCFRSDQAALDLALPLMRAVAEGQRLNVGLAVADGLEMVYLESVRQKRLGAFRRIVPGYRIPMELTSLGRAYLSTLDEKRRTALLHRLGEPHGAAWPALEAQIRQAIADVERTGCCHAQWQAGMVAIAAPLRAPNGVVQVLNLSFPLPAQAAASITRYSAMLLALAARVDGCWQAQLASA